MSTSWAQSEYATINLGDLRRNERSKVILEQLSTIAESPPAAAKSPKPSLLNAMYRFMRNDAVSPDALLAPHFRESSARTAKYDRVLLVQDTTDIELTKPKRQVDGAGPLSSNAKRGFYLHPLMAYSESGIPLGLVALKRWVRSELDTKSSAAKKKQERGAKPIEDKESYRWIEMIRAGKQVAVANPQTQYIGVSDSESDVTEVFGEAVGRPDNYHLLIRACQNRVVVQSEHNSDARHIRESVLQTPVRFRSEIQVRERTSKVLIENRKRRKSRKARSAVVEIRTASIAIKSHLAASSSESGKRQRARVSVNVVHVLEVDPPEGETPIEWTLLTTLPIQTEEQVREIIACYAVRWNIEVYFMTLKSGLGVERLQYRKLTGYLNATAMLMVVAWRVQCVTQVGRDTPDEDCEAYFTAAQWKSAWLVINKGEPLPKSPPTMGEFTTLVATLGGYINRKQQGPPGVRTIWRGMRRLDALAEAYLAFGPASRNICGL